jgi:DNA-binding NtrC family response regulator
MLSSTSDGTVSGHPAADPRGDGALHTRGTSSKKSLRKLVREAARDAESRIILDTLQQHRWNRRRTAEALNISYRSLMYKMKYCNLRDIDLPDSTEAK